MAVVPFHNAVKHVICSSIFVGKHFMPSLFTKTVHYYILLTSQCGIPWIHTNTYISLSAKRISLYQSVSIKCPQFYWFFSCLLHNISIIVHATLILINNKFWLLLLTFEWLLFVKIRKFIRKSNHIPFHKKSLKFSLWRLSSVCAWE